MPYGLAAYCPEISIGATTFAAARPSAYGYRGIGTTAGGALPAFTSDPAAAEEAEGRDPNTDEAYIEAESERIGAANAGAAGAASVLVLIVAADDAGVDTGGVVACCFRRYSCPP